MRRGELWKDVRRRSLLGELGLSTLNESKQMIKEIEICEGKSYLHSLPGSRRLRVISERDLGASWLRIQIRRER